MYPSALPHQRTLAILAAAAVASTLSYDERAANLKELDANAHVAAAMAEAARLNHFYIRVVAPIYDMVSKAEITVSNPIDLIAVLASLVSIDDAAAGCAGRRERGLT